MGGELGAGRKDRSKGQNLEILIFSPILFFLEFQKLTPLNGIHSESDPPTWWGIGGSGADCRRRNPLFFHLLIC